LRQAPAEKTPVAIAVIDFETDPFAHGVLPRAFACGFSTRGLTQTKWGSESTVVKWGIEKCKKFKGIVYAHNGGKFDFPGYIFRYGGPDLWGSPVLLISSRIVSVRLGECELRDSYAILPAPLKAYDKGEISYAKFRAENRERFKPEILDYLRRDCTSLHALVSRFTAEHGTRVLTAAGAAIQAIRGFGEAPERLSESLDAQFRPWYFGGRVQALKPGVHRGKFTVYDLKSAYPHAMLSDHPVGKKFKMIRRPKEILPSDLVCCAAEGRGHWPIRRKNELAWPRGEMTTFYITGWEYLAHRKLPHAVAPKVKFVYRCEKLGSFTKYVRHFYEEKRAAEMRGDKAGRLISKILINSGYGKLAQRPDKWREYVIVSDQDVITAKGGWIEEYVDEENHFAIWSKPSERPKYYWNVATAASITGFVRARLIGVIARHSPYYCDTDSIIVNSTVKIATGENLGDWAKELEGDLLVIAGKKLYGLRLLPKYAKNPREAMEKGYHWSKGRAWKIASKGCRLTPKQLLAVAAGETVTHRNRAPTFSLKSHASFIVRNIKMTA
jgi:DNA polymerase type B, organellar and viral